MTPKEKLQEILDKGKLEVTSALNSIQSEFQTRKDFIVKHAAISFNTDTKGSPVINIGQEDLYLTDFSENQLYNRTNIPPSYAKKLLSLCEYDLYKENLTRMNIKSNQNGLLIRHVGQNIKGILSPSYKRMDASPIFESFIEQSLTEGFMPYRGLNTNSRYSISFLHPNLIELIPGEHIVYGINLTTSDYGASALDLSLSLMRVICTNLAIGYDMLRKVHLGKRFNSEDDFIELSNETHALDTKTIASAVKDTIKVAPTHIEQLNDTITNKIQEEFSLSSAIEKLKKKNLSKEILDKVKTTYDTMMPIEALPKVDGYWRFSNTLSLIANSYSGDTKLDLEKEAFKVLAA